MSLFFAVVNIINNLVVEKTSLFEYTLMNNYEG